jgi:hypothetical protein
MSVIIPSFQGRFGNACLQYLFCRALAEKHRLELRTEPWIGERVFQIEHPRPESRERPRFGEIELTRPRTSFEFLRDISTNNPEFEFRGYAQMANCMLYTKRQAQSWLKIREEWMPALNRMLAHHPDTIIGHRRVGDYIGYGYPVVSEASYRGACREFGLNEQSLRILSEENPAPPIGLPDDLAFLPDFYRMMTAPTLLRANSSFSWLAALLGNGLVLAPVIEGLEGGKEHDCRFVAGNWPRFANLDFVQDLHVAP